MNIAEIPRSYVRFALNAGRLPVQVAGRALHRGAGDWPPALAYEQLEANIKQVVGSLLRDEVLVDEGQVEGAKVARLRDAITLEASARELARTADRTLAERRADEARHRREAAEALDERVDAAEQDEQRRKRKADDAARAEKAKADERRQAAKDKLADKERAERAEQLTRQKAALGKQKKAAAQAADVVAIDRALEGTKAARRNGR